MKSYKLAGFYTRISAYLLDTIIQALVIYYPIYKYLDVNYADNPLAIRILPLFICLMSAICIWQLLFWRFAGGTPGQLIFGLRILKADTGKKASIPLLFLRYLGNIISHAGLFLGLFWSLIDSRRQGWHDKISGTVILKKDIYTEEDVEESNPSIFPILPSERDKSYWKTGKILIGFTFIILVLLKIVGFYDEPLQTETLQWLQRDFSDSGDYSENDFYYVLGFAAAPSDSSEEYGHSKVLPYHDLFVKLKLEDYVNADIPQIQSDSLFSRDFMIEISSIFKEESAAEKIKNNKDVLRHEYTKYVYLEERYENIGSHGYYKNTLPAHQQCVNPALMNLVIYQALYLLNNGLDYLEGDTEALENIENDYKRWLKMYPQVDTFLDKLAYTVFLQRDISILNILMDADTPESSELHQLIISLPEMSPEQRSFDAAANYEFMFSVNYVFPYFVPEGYIYLAEPLRINTDMVKASRNFAIFKPNHFLNHHQEMLTEIVRLSKLDAVKFKQELAEPAKPVLHWLDYAIDPFGSNMVHLEPGALVQNLVKAFDINGSLHLLKAKSLLSSEEAAQKDIDALLKSYAAKYHNPYTLEAFRYDDAANQIYYEGPFQDNNLMSRSLGL